ncbi:MAG: hypothetical protein KKF33_06890 [Alphaproteobacteria bacterium]|nr:hypothetical protein [Alphaproteobacteria bacterium]
MDDKWALPGVSRDQIDLDPAKPAAQPSAAAAAVELVVEPEIPADKAQRRNGASLWSLAVGAVGLVALGVSLWVYADTQRELKRVATDIAQIRVSLELFGKQQSGGAAASGAATSLTDIANRLALLEANQRLGGAASSSPAALPTIGGDSNAAAAGNGEDCLPSGMRFMVAAGDSYPVCGTTGSVGIAAIDNGYITLSDGTVIAEGATVGLPGTACMVGVLPSEGDAVSGFAEIRVAC